MRDDPFLLDLLCCPACQGRLMVGEIMERAGDGHILSGDLCCAVCGARYPIHLGVPRFMPGPLSASVAKTVAGFGYEWKQANPQMKNTRFTAAETFLGFIEPVQPAYFAGKVVLDGGCGLGRFTYWAHEFGASAVVGMDLSEAVEAAFENTRHLPRALIIQADLLAPLPLRPAFDYVFSVGVLHHTAHPRRAFDAIVRVTKPGGGISAWVYGREHNGWIIYGLNPIRQILTSRLPVRLLRGLSILVTIPLYLLVKGIYKPVGSAPRLAGLRRILFYFDYLYFLSQFGFRELALIVFDHLHPELAAYLTQAEFTAWFTGNHLQDIAISSRAGNSWRGFGVRPA